MAQTQTPFGLLARWHPSGQDRSNQYENCLISGMTVNLWYGTPVLLAVGAGTSTPLFANATTSMPNCGVTIPTGATVLVPVPTQGFPALGSFAGVEYTDVNGRRQYSKFWPSGLQCQTGTYPIAYVWDDPQVIYEIQLDGAIDTSAYQQVIGRQTNFNSADLTAVAGNATPIGQSAQRASATLVASNGATYGTSNTGQLVIVETPDISSPGPLSGQGSIMDPFPSIFCKINRHQLANPTGMPATV